MSNIVKYRLTGTLQTDGDFYVDLNGYKSDLIKQYIAHDSGDYYWYINMETDDPYEVRDFLQALMVSFRVGTHYWLVKGLYNFVEPVLDKVVDCIQGKEWDNDMLYVYNYYGGNYEGTELLLEKIVDEEKEKA